MLDWIQFDLEILFKFGLTALLGLIIGLEREIKRKPLGLRTCLVISIASCLLTIVSIQSAYQFQGSPDGGVTIRMDPLRLAAQIVSGIGFLGAGVILRRGNDSITGLTTAAIIWGAAGIGIAVGAGFYFAAVTGVILIIISVEVLPFIMSYIGPRQLRENELLIVLHINEQYNAENVLSELNNNKISVHHLRIRDLTEGGCQLKMIATAHFKKSIPEIYNTLSNIEGVIRVDIENLET